MPSAAGNFAMEPAQPQISEACSYVVCNHRLARRGKSLTEVGSTTDHAARSVMKSSSCSSWKAPTTETINIKVGVPRIPTDKARVNEWSTHSMIQWQNDAMPFTAAGGDQETRPKNTALNFLQKIAADAEIPFGAVIPIGAAEGVSTASQMSPWLKCDGGKMPKADFPELFSLLGTRYNTLALTDKDNVYVPELRGLFVRGVLHNRDALYDPDSSRRTAPDATQGADFAGTNQRYGTNVNQWEVSIPHFPRTYIEDGRSHMVDCGLFSGSTNMADGDYRTTQRWTGFAKETRPENAAVNYYIAGRKHATLPVSGIIATMDIIDDPSWLLCDGRLVARSDYPELCQKINYAWGGFENTHCNIPNLGGRFLRGADLRNPRMDGPMFDPVLDNDRFQRRRVGIAPETETIWNTCGAGSLQWSAIGIPDAWRNAQEAVVGVETLETGGSVQRIDLEPKLGPQMEVGHSSNGIAARVPHATDSNALGIGPFYASKKNEKTFWTTVNSQDNITAPMRTYVNFYIKARS